MTNKKNLGIIGLIMLALVAAVLVYRDTRTSKIEITDSNGANILKNTGIEMTGDGKVTIVPIEEKKLPQAPSLNREATPLKTLSPEVVKLVEDRMTATIANLKKDSRSFDNWIALGIERKTLGDYEGAREAWEYAKIIDSNNLVSWNNLGDLYHFYLRDYKKSEENWKKTIVLNPDFIQGYRGLYELYSYSMKEKSTEIPVILKQGIARNPKATDLKTLLVEYEKSAAK